MKHELLERIKQLGGNIDGVKGKSLKDDLLSITFDTVLYLRPEDTPWATAEESEPIYGIGEFVDQNAELLEKDEQAFYDKMLETFYCLTEDSHGQVFWQNELFTPYKEGTEDYEEWNGEFADEDSVDLNPIVELTNDKTPDMINVFYSYGFPDGYYIALSDPDQSNPTLFGTDQEEFFSEVTNEGTLLAFLNRCMTKEELVEIVKKALKG